MVITFSSRIIFVGFCWSYGTVLAEFKKQNTTLTDTELSRSIDLGEKFTCHGPLFRLDWKYWPEFRWSPSSGDSLLRATLWISNRLSPFASHVRPVVASLLARSRPSLAPTHLFVPVRFRQHSDLHPRHVGLWPLLSREQSRAARLCDVYHIDGISDRVPHHECVRLRVHSRERMAIHEEARRSDGICGHVSAESILHDGMCPIGTPRLPSLDHGQPSPWQSTNLLLNLDHLLDARHLLHHVCDQQFSSPSGRCLLHSGNVVDVSRSTTIWSISTLLRIVPICGFVCTAYSMPYSAF